MPKESYKLRKGKGRKIYPKSYSLKSGKKYRSLEYVTPKDCEFEKIEDGVMIFKKKEIQK